jgi:decaprenyl-phosphate phosphoribosyltransferase
MRAALEAMRPQQWVKNVLVFVAPAAAGKILHLAVFVHSCLAFAAFSLVASATYLVNDIRDADADRRHPKKRHRPVAAGRLAPVGALALAIALALGGLALPLLLPHPAGLYLILGVYLLITSAYSAGLKHVPIIELAAVASGFFLRAYAGALANHIPVSEWFLVVISFGALFLVLGKRSAEKHHDASSHRAVLAEYSKQFLHSALTLSATVVVTAYCLWAFDTSATGLSSQNYDALPVRLSVAPVVLAMLFVLRSAESPDGEKPEDLVLRNHVVQSLLVSWVLLLLWARYR